MQPSYRILQAADYADSFGAEDAFALDVLVGLSAERKEISSKYLYDEKGSELFRQITRLPEYYITNCELEIIQRHADKIAEYLDHEHPCNIIELGAGAGEKTPSLLKQLMQRRLDLRYVPIDVSEEAMQLLISSLASQLPSLKVNGLVTEYFNGLKWMNGQPDRKNLVLFLGSSIGNFTHAENRVFLRSLWNCLGHDDLLMIGFDLRKDIDLLLRAYNDANGVTREFNLNLLRRINRELGGDFDLDKWRHYGTYDVFSGGMESYLVSSEKQSVFIKKVGRRFSFEEWEPIHTENSYKYLISDIEELAGETGYTVCEHLLDSRQFFADSIWRVNKPEARKNTRRSGQSTVG